MRRVPADRSPSPLRWVAIALALVVIGFLGWSFRPSPTVDGDAGAGPALRPLLLDATADGALVQMSGQGSMGGANGQTQPSVVSWSSSGQRRWSSATLTGRAMVLCGTSCSIGYGSATLDSFSRPEIADPPAVQVSASGERAVSSAPRARVLWAGAAGERIEASAGALGEPVRVISVRGGTRRELALDARGDPLVLADGAQAVLLTHPTMKTAAVVPLVRRSGGWRAKTAIAVPDWNGGCFAVRRGVPEAVVYSAEATTAIVDGRATPIQGAGGVGACAIDAAGPLLASYNGAETQLRQVGDRSWTARMTGTRSISANPAFEGAVISDDVRGTATFLAADGSTVSVVPAYGARVLSSSVVLLDRTGTPSWRAMP